MSDDRHVKTSISLALPKIITPLRIITVLTLLPIFIFQVPWGTSSIIFYGYFPVLLASFSAEIIYFVKNRNELARLALKYMMIIPFEFIGVFVFAMASLPFPNREEIHNLEINITIIVLGTGMIVELFYFILLSRQNFQLDKIRILAVIPLALLIVYEGIFIYQFLH